MNLPKLAICLVALGIVTDAAALQLGQLETYSKLGSKLEASIQIYALSPAQVGDTTFEIKPEFALAGNNAARIAVDSLSLQLVAAPGEQPYIALRSALPISEPIVNFRLRATSGSVTTISHYTIALSPVAYSRNQQRANRREPIGTKTDRPAQAYGPIRPGQTLWQILRDLGLNSGGASDLMARIVDENPQAFSQGDANRLRVGAMLAIPASFAYADSASTSSPDVVLPAIPVTPAKATSTASAAANAAVATSVATVPASANAPSARNDAQMQARLAALSSKFAAIKEKYAMQKSAEAALASAIEPVTESAVYVPEASKQVVEEAKSAAPSKAKAALPALRRPTSETTTSNESPMSLTTTLLVAIVALGVLIGATLAIRTLIVRRRRLLAHGRVNAGDQVLVAKIAAKAEKRLQLEDEVKRRISEKRAPKIAAAATPRRPVANVSSSGSLDEIENRIAHGQYEEAEAMLNEVIAKTPQNARAKLRLAEIYYLNERIDEFTSIASDLAANHRAAIGNDGWQRVMRMGKVIAPDRPPFSGPVSVERKA